MKVLHEIVKINRNYLENENSRTGKYNNWNENSARET
jgi:hypothetical protein